MEVSNDFLRQTLDENCPSRRNWFIVQEAYQVYALTFPQQVSAIPISNRQPVDDGAPCKCFFGEMAGAVVDVEAELACVDGGDIEVLTPSLSMSANVGPLVRRLADRPAAMVTSSKPPAWLFRKRISGLSTLVTSVKVGSAPSLLVIVVSVSSASGGSPSRSIDAGVARRGLRMLDW